MFSRLLKEFADSSLGGAAQLHLGQCHYEQGKYDRALSALGKVSSNDREHGDDAAYWAAKCRLKQKRFKQAAKTLNQAVERHADSELLPEMTYDLATARLREGDQQGALRALGRFRERFPEHGLAAEVLYLLAMTEHQQGRYDKSQTYCRAFLEEHASHAKAPSVVFLVGENDYLASRYEEAAGACRRWELVPNSEISRPK